MTQMRVEPDFPVRPDATGAASARTTASGTLYAPETKEEPVVVAEEPSEPKHSCAVPHGLSRTFSTSAASVEAEKELPPESLFHCECGLWYIHLIYWDQYDEDFTHYWREVRRWDWKARKRIRLLESQEAADRIMKALGGVDVE